MLAAGHPAWDDARLRRIKAVVDPGNMIRANHTIPPAGQLGESSR